MQPIEVVSLIVIAMAGLYLLVLGGVALLKPAWATRFLLGFAGSQATHFLELALRLAVGAACVVAAPRLPLSGGFSLFGWVLLVSTAGLLVVPWHWHRRFAQQAVPRAVRYIALIGWASLAAGAFVLVAVARSGGA